MFPHYYNNLGCLHHMMKKPNLAIYYFKNALDRLEAGESGSGQGGTAGWVTQSQVELEQVRDRTGFAQHF